MLVGLVLTSATLLSVAVGGDIFDPIVGDDWTGTLTYADYTSGEKTMIPVTVAVREVKENRYELAFRYTDEPDANDRQFLSIRKEGRFINGNEIESNTEHDDGTVVIVARGSGKDNDQPATFVYTYTVSASAFSIRKEVTYTDDNDLFFRNEYSFERKDSVSEDIKVEAITPLGNYAIGIAWSDGHSSGIYTWDYLRELAQGVSA